MSIETANCATAAIDGAPAWVYLLPVGQIKARDGRVWRNDDPAAVVAATMAEGRDLPIDYDHAIDRIKSAPGEAPAAGWIDRVELRADGIWGRVSWTERAKAALADREWRFISPVFAFLKGSGRILRIFRAGLTNEPAIGELTALATWTDLAAAECLEPMEADVCRRLGLRPSDYLRAKAGR